MRLSLLPAWMAVPSEGGWSATSRVGLRSSATFHHKSSACINPRPPTTTLSAVRSLPHDQHDATQSHALPGHFPTFFSGWTHAHTPCMGSFTGESALHESPVIVLVPYPHHAPSLPIPTTPSWPSAYPDPLQSQHQPFLAVFVPRVHPVYSSRGGGGTYTESAASRNTPRTRPGGEACVQGTARQDG